MNFDKTSKPKGAWTVVGEKNKKSSHRQKQKCTKTKTMTPEDIYYTNLVSEEKEESNVSECLMNTIVDQTRDLSPQDSVDVLSKIASFTIETMASILKKAINDISDIKDDQKTVIAINGYLENTDKIQSVINTSVSKYDENITKMNSMKKESIENIKKFLTTCGIDEIPSYNHKDTEIANDEDYNTPSASIALDSSKKSYVSAIGTAGGLVVEKQPVKIVNKIVQPRNLMVDTGIVDINMPVISQIQDSIDFTMSYLDYCNVFVIRMGETVFTTGPGNFVNLKNSSGKTKHAKRCLNPQPCRYKNCKYYHDPCIVYDDYNVERKFALSYILQMLNAVKNSNDIIENKAIRNPNFVRDLVQLGGIILVKAAQIKTLYFSGKKI